MRPLSAVLICLPGSLLALWYAWRAYDDMTAFRALTPGPAPSLEDFQLWLHDTLRADARRLLQPAPPEPPRLPQIHILFDNAELDRMEASLALPRGRPYVSALLEAGGKSYTVMVRARGDRGFRLNPKRPVKVKLERGEQALGHRVFNLLAESSPLLAGEEVIQELAASLGLLVPRTTFVRVRHNGADRGVMRLIEPAGEELLRAHRRYPGSLYSGNLDPDDAGDLWSDTSAWKKIAWRIPEEQKDRSELERLLDRVARASQIEFAAFARRELDIERFAALDALETAFAIRNRDSRRNQKLYFDPYRGRFEPVAGGLRGFRQLPDPVPSTDPLRLRLSLLPEYNDRRGRWLWRLLTGPASVSEVRRRWTETIAALVPDLLSDPVWKASDQLPVLPGGTNRILRPMDLARLGLAIDNALVTLAERHAALTADLQRNPLALESPGPLRLGRFSLRLWVEGPAGVELRSFHAVWPAGCGGRMQVWHREQPLGPEVAGADFVLEQPLLLLPGAKLRRRRGAPEGPDGLAGQARPAAYDFEVRADCLPLEIRAEGRQSFTQNRIRSRAIEARAPSDWAGGGDVPTLQAGAVSAHPGELRPAPAETVALGPGVVELPDGRVFETNQRVTIEPGTTLRLGTDASLVFLGPVAARGTAARPIRIEPLSDAPFGGVILQGTDTAGSRLEHIRIEGGSHARFGLGSYSGMLNLRDSRDIAIKEIEIVSRRRSPDLLHGAYLERLAIDGARLRGAARDGIDLEFVSGELRGLDIRDSSDECLDLMGADIFLADSLLSGCGGNALSAGEESRVRVRDSLLARSRVGLLAKNASRVELADSLFFENRTGIRINRRDVWYSGPSRVSAETVVLVGSEEEIDLDRASAEALDVGRIERHLPPFGLSHLVRDVLGLREIGELPAYLGPDAAGGHP
jgi:hypothetical protein